jgi:predicted transcriptional regulator
MPSKLARKRTDAESQAFKAKIVSLRRKCKSMVEIAQELGITKQYVSLVLNEAGLGGKLVNRTPNARVQAGRDCYGGVEATIAQLQQEGDYTLADNLRLILKRRAAGIELRKSKRSVSRKPV